jgi:hypothetical protein
LKVKEYRRYPDPDPKLRGKSDTDLKQIVPDPHNTDKEDRKG